MAKRRLKTPDLPDGDRRRFFLFMQDLVVENGDLSTANLGRLVHFNHQGVYRALTGPTMPSLRLTVAISHALGGERAEELARSYWSAGVKEQRRAAEDTPHAEADAATTPTSRGEVSVRQIAGSLQSASTRDLEDPAKDEVVLEQVVGAGVGTAEPSETKFEEGAAQAGAEAITGPEDSPLETSIVGAVGGDRNALRRVLETIRPLALRYCRTRLDSASADDVAQEVCLDALTRLPTLVEQWGSASKYGERKQSFIGWLYAIMARKVADAEAERTGELVGADQAQTTAPSDPGNLADARMKRLLSLLPPKQREVLILRVVLGLNAEETAEAAGMSPGAVRVTQHRALARLKHQILESESHSGTE